MLTWSSFQAAVTTGHCLNATEVFVASVESPFFCVYMCVWLYLMQMRSKSCYFPLHSGHLFSTCCFVSHSFTSLQRKIWAFGVGGAVHKASLLQESHISSACVASGSLPYKRSSEITHTPSDARLRRLACCRAAKDVILRRKPE